MISTPDRRLPRLGIAVCAAVLCLYPAAASFGGTGAAAQLEAARTALARRDGIAAEVALRRALDLGAERGVVAARMGEAEMLQGDTAQARRWLEPGRFAPGEQAHGFRMLGRLEMEDDDLPAAGRAFDRALQFAPDDADLWIDIGRMRYRGGQQLEAIAAVRRAVALDADNVGALVFQGQIVRDSTGPLSALVWFAQARQQSPDDTDVLGEYAATLGELGRAKEMLAVTRRMIELDPRNPQAFYLQAVLAARAGEDDLARRLLLRAGEAVRGMSSAMMLDGVLEFRAGNLATATDIFERLSQRQPDNRNAAVLLARALYQAGDMDELVERFAPMARREDASPYLLTLIGRAYEALDQREKAAVFLDRAAAPRPVPRLVAIAGSLPVSVLEPRWKADPYLPDNTIPLVRQLLADGDTQRAISVAEQIVARFPGSADARMLAGDAHMLGKAYTTALEHYRIAADIRFSRTLLVRMAAACVGSGHASQADALMRRYLREHPMDGRVAGWAADFAMLRKDGPGAQILLNHAFRQGLGAHDPELLAQRAMQALNSGDGDAARNDALSAYRLQRGSGELALVLAKVLAASGGHKDATVDALKAKAARMGIGA